MLSKRQTAGDVDEVLIPTEAATFNEMMSPLITR
jgi:hypothetical protein